MTSPVSTLTALIERLEKQSGSNTNLDMALAKHVGTYMRTSHQWPAYTASLDAALTLVPEGWRSLSFEGTGATWACYLGRFDTNAATPAIALCIAALKSREAVDGV